mgnify:CR=1 FL=1
MDDTHSMIDESIKIISSGQSFNNFKDDFYKMNLSLGSMNKDEKQTKKPTQLK